MFLISATPDGSPIVARPNSVIPYHVIFQVHEMVNNGSTLEDAVTYIRGKLVPAGKLNALTSQSPNKCWYYAKLNFMIMLDCCRLHTLSIPEEYQ